MSRPAPTDEEIIECLIGYSSLATYVVKNSLRGKYKGIKTPAVLRRLKKLEAAGEVIRVPENRFFAGYIYWAVAPQEQS